jgi:hypothetical protein
MTMPSNSMSVARTHDDDVSEAHEAAGMEATAQGVAADAHAAGVQMLDATLTQDRKNDQAADNKLDEAAAKDADGAVETAANDRSADADQVAANEADHGVDVAAPEAQAVTQSEQQVEEQARSAFLGELRDQHEALKDLDDAALERILDCAGDVQKMRGQLVEELGNLQLDQLAKEMGPDCSFIRGDQIRDQNNRQVTDGMIVREAEDGMLDVVGIVEAKAGRASRRELTASRESFENLSERDFLELQRAAIDEFRQQNGMDNPREADWASSQDILNEHGAEIDALMRDMHGADIGQLSRDFERLMPNAGDDAVTLRIDGADRDIRVNRAHTEAYAVTPSDVSTDRTLENFKEKEPNIRTNSINVDLTAGEITGLAQSIQDAERTYRADAVGPENVQSQTAGEAQTADAEPERTQQANQDQAAQQSSAQQSAEAQAQAELEQQIKSAATAQAAALQQEFEETQELERSEQALRERARKLREEAEEAFEHA